MRTTSKSNTPNPAPHPDLPKRLSQDEARDLSKKLLEAHKKMVSDHTEWENIEEATKKNFAHRAEFYKLDPIIGPHIQTSPNGDQHFALAKSYQESLARFQILTREKINFETEKLLAFNVVSKTLHSAPKDEEKEGLLVPGQYSFLKSAFLAENTVVVVYEIHRVLDSTPKEKYIPYSAQMFQYGAKKNKDGLPPKVPISYSIDNEETKNFIKDALEELGGEEDNCQGG